MFSKSPAKLKMVSVQSKMETLPAELLPLITPDAWGFLMMSRTSHLMAARMAELVAGDRFSVIDGEYLFSSQPAGLFFFHKDGATRIDYSDRQGDVLILEPNLPGGYVTPTNINTVCAYRIIRQSRVFRVIPTIASYMGDSKITPGQTQPYFILRMYASGNRCIGRDGNEVGTLSVDGKKCDI